MTVRCGWCGKKLQRRTLVVGATLRIPLCRSHEKYRWELIGTAPERSVGRNTR